MKRIVEIIPLFFQAHSDNKNTFPFLDLRRKRRRRPSSSSASFSPPTSFSN